MTTKTIYFVTGDKGGVGKSFFSRTFIDYLKSQDLGFSAYDSDATNSTLFRFYPDDTNHLDTSIVGGLDELVNRLESATHPLVVDCGSGAMDKITHWMSEIDFRSLQLDLDIRVVLFFILGTDKDSLKILKDMTGYFGSNASYVIVRNLGRGSDFSQYDQSNTREKLLSELHAKEIELTALSEKVSLAIDKKNLTFTQAQSSQELHLADRQRVKLFKLAMKQKIDQCLA